MRESCWIAFVALTSVALAGCQKANLTEVVAYVAVDRGDAEPILQRFESETGVRVRAVYDAEAAKTTGLVTRLLAEAGRPRCDVFWNNELVQTLLLADRGVLEPYESPAARQIPTEFKDSGGMWTGIATRARVIVYNTKLVEHDQVPRSIFDLTKPEWRGKAAIANPQFGTTRFHAAALFSALGPEQAQKFFQSLLSNEIRIVDGNAMVKNLVARAHPNASPICVGLTDTDDVRSGQADGEPVDMVFPDQNALGTLVVPSTVCLVRGAAHATAAKQLVDFLVGPEVESLLATSRAGYMPVRPSGLAGGATSGHASVRAMDVTYSKLLEQLEPSTRWTKEHFRP